MDAPLQSRLDVLYPGDTSEPGRCEHPANGASRAPAVPSHAEATSAAAPSRSPEPQWPSPPQWPSRPRPFRVPPKSRARRSSCASASCTRARIPAVALAPGTPRRRALDQALAELDGGPKAKHPSTAWRREFSLLLGLERLLSEDEPKLADGTVLSAHQVDALSGTLTALLAEAQRTRGNGNGRAAASASPELLASADDPRPGRGRRRDRRAAADGRAPQRRRLRRGRGGRGSRTRTRTRTTRTRTTTRTTTSSARSSAPPPTRTTRTRTRTTLDDEVERGEEDEPTRSPSCRATSEEEPRDWVEDEDEEESLAEQPEDPNAAKRFWFEHATGAGKTVAALGFVEASQTGGVLILTHRRNLVDQFHGELRDRGYSKRISRAAAEGRGLGQGAR